MAYLIGPEAASILVFAFLVAFGAGLVKGLVGFAMPMVLISGLSTVVEPELALAWLIVPTLVANGWQALRQGAGAAWQSMRKFRVFLWTGAIALLIAAQFVRVLPGPVMLILIGVPIAIYSAMTLLGRPLRLPHNPGHRVEATVGALAGVSGGISGVWGPPTVAMLTALDIEKKEHVRVQGVIYGLGAVTLVAAHLLSGVLNRETIPFSVLLTVPALAGLVLGFRVHDRIDQDTFRRIAMVVLLIGALNLVRRGLMTF